MFRKILTTTILAFFLASCSLGVSEEPTTPDENAQVQGAESSTIIWWGLFEDKENVQPLIDKFKETHPDVDIQYIEKDKATYLSELAVVLQDGNPNTDPDIFIVHNSAVENYSGFTSSAPSSILSSDSFKSEMHSFVSDDFAYDNQVHGVPLWVDMLGVIYNKDQLLTTGDTVIAADWDNFQRQAKNMTVLNGTQMTRGGFAAGTSSNVEFYFDTMNLLFLQARALPLTEETKLLPFADTEKNKVNDALTFYKTFTNTNKTWDTNQKLDTAAFIEGKVSTIIAPTWRILDIIAFNNNRNLNLNFATAPVPQLNTSQKVNFATYWGYMVSKESKNTNISWEFLRFISSSEGQELYEQTVKANGRTFSLISPRVDLISNYSSNPYLKPYTDSIADIVSWRMVNAEKVKPVYKDLIDGKITVDDVLVKVNEIRQNKDEL